MSDWTFLDKFGKDVAKRTGLAKDEVWKALLGGRLTEEPGKEGGLKVDFTEEEVAGFGQKLKDWIIKRPAEFATLFTCVAAAPTAMVLTPAVVGMLGFGPLGIAAGSLAASAQAVLGPIPAASTFAILQSAGMGGYGLIVVKAIAASGSVAGTCSAAAVNFLKAMKKEKCEVD